MGYKVIGIIVGFIIFIILLLESIKITSNSIIFVFPKSFNSILLYINSSNAYTYFYFIIIISFVCSLLWFFGNSNGDKN